MAIETVKVELLGSSFSIQTDESREYLEAVLDKLRVKYAEVKEASRVDDPLKISILAGIYLVDELMRAKVDGSIRYQLDDERGREMSSIAERLIAAIDDILE
mgnify:CR=1 FL=1